MRQSKIKAKLKRNEPVELVTLHLTDPSTAEMTSLLGFDGIWLDLEHHGYSLETAQTLMRAARVGGSDIMVRPAKGEFMQIGRVLESGAQGILYPRCDNAEEARQAVTWSKFAPLGRRGFDGGNPDVPYGSMSMVEYIKAANEQTFVAIQIEEPAALEHVEAIATVEGVDVLFLGPADFSILAGIPGQIDHPVMRNAIKRIDAAARAAGKHWGTVSGSTERTRQLMDMGARFICQGCDIMMIKVAMENIQKQLGPLGFTFENRLG
jgi:4-hydroxy-2-oxoheptanedioate aldolase